MGREEAAGRVGVGRCDTINAFHSYKRKEDGYTGDTKRGDGQLAYM